MTRTSRKTQPQETEQDMAGKSTKRKIRLIAIAAALATGGSLIALLPTANAATPPSAGKADAADCQQHKIHVEATDDIPWWDVYGDLYDGNGNNVHHWEEKNKTGNGDYVDWKFNYCGDNGWADVSVEVQHGRAEIMRIPKKEKLKLDRDYCWRLEEHGDAGEKSVELVDSDC
jgi:hypothetical protein